MTVRVGVLAPFRAGGAEDVAEKCQWIQVDKTAKCRMVNVKCKSMTVRVGALAPFRAGGAVELTPRTSYSASGSRRVCDIVLTRLVDLYLH